MEFLHPEFLYYMALPLLILFAFLLTQKESVATFFTQETIERLQVSANMISMRARNVLFFIIALLMVIALAEPVIPEGKIEIKAKSADIMVALDISDSMLAEDLYPNRLKLAKEKVLSLLRLAPNERMGVIAFAKNSYMVSPLSFDHDAVSFLLRKLSTDSITEKGTDFLSMLEVVAKNSPKESTKYLLMLSDGGDKSDFSQEIAFAKSNNIVVFVLGVATKNGAPIKQKNGEFIKHRGEIIVSKLNRDIAEFATQTGGVFIASTNASDDVSAMLAEIEARSEKKELKSQEIARYIPLFYFPLGVALLLLLVATSSMSKRRSIWLPSAFVFALFLNNSSELDAGVLDFVELKKAKEAYESGEYEQSAALYKKYADEAQTPESYYNTANALYKNGEYAEAREFYKRASFTQPHKQAKNLSNLGNAYAKEPRLENLKSAQEAYEKSLKLFDDPQTRENLEAVEEVIKEQEKQEQEQQEQQEQNQEQEQNKENEENQEQKQGDDSTEDQNQNQEDDGDKEQEDGDKNQENQNQKNQNQENQNQKNEPQKSEENQDLDEKDETQSDQNQTQTQELSEPQEPQESEEQNATAEASNPLDKSEEMSESEEQKWLQMLGEGSATYLYRLNENSSREESIDEKPW